MTHSMSPVIKKVNTEKKNDQPIPAARYGEETPMIVHQSIKRHRKNFGKRTCDLFKDAATDIAHGIIHSIQILMRDAIVDNFNPDKDEEDGNGEYDGIERHGELRISDW